MVLFTLMQWEIDVDKHTCTQIMLKFCNTILLYIKCHYIKYHYIQQ